MFGSMLNVPNIFHLFIFYVLRWIAFVLCIFFKFLLLFDNYVLNFLMLYISANL